MPTAYALESPATVGLETADFASFYRRHLKWVYGYLYARLGTREETEDVTSAAFIRAWHSFGTYRPKEPFGAWLFTIVRRALVDHLRSRRDSPIVAASEDAEAADGAAGPEDAALASENRVRVRAMLASLKPEQQEVLSLRYASEFSFAEIARVVGKREDAVKKVAYRALEQLRRSYTDD